MIKVIARLNPFESEVVYCDVEPGLSITEILGSENERIHVEVDGVPIPLEARGSTYPRSGEVVNVVVAPQGIETAIIAVAATMSQALGAVGLGAAMTAATSLATAAGVTSAVGLSLAGIAGGIAGIAAMVAPMIMPFLIKPQMPSMSGGASYGGGTATRFNLLNSQNNPSLQYGVLPKLYGEFRIVPPLAGTPYTRIRNAVIVGQPGTQGFAGKEATQEFHMLLCLGYGPLRIGANDTSPVIGNPAGTSPGNLTFKTVQGTNYPGGSVLDQDLTAILIGNTPFRSLEGKGARYLISTAKWFSENTDSANLASYTRDIEEDSLSLQLNPRNTPANSDSPTQTSYDGFYHVRTTAPDALDAEVDIVFDSLFTALMKEDNTGTQDVTVSVHFNIYKKRSIHTASISTVVSPGANGFQNGVVQIQEVDPNRFEETKNRWMIHQSFSAVASSRVPCAWTVPIKGLSKVVDGVRTDYFGRPIDPGETFDIAVVRVMTVWTGRKIVSSSSNANIIALRSLKGKKVWDVSEDAGTPDMLLMALQFPASSGLNGSIEAVSVHAKSVLKRPVADTEQAWASNQALKWVTTASPAWAFADVFMGMQLQEPFKKDRLDWPSLIRWSNWCDGTTNKHPDGSRKITDYNWYHVEEETMLDRARTITSCGRATWTINGGLFGVIQDDNFWPVQMLSPRNSRGLEITKSYPKIPNALRVRYVHPETWQQDEVIVLDDYYLYQVGNQWVDNWGVAHTPGQDGYKKAKTFEVLETQGVTNKAQAKREGRYHLANLRLRPEFFTCEMDFENLVAQRGDCVLLSHDVLLRGWSFGRIKKISPPNAEEGIGDYIIATDTDFEVTAGENFAIQVRSMNTDPLSSVPLAFVEIPINNPPGKYTEFWVGVSQAAKIDQIAVDDLFVFGPLDAEGNPSASLLAKITQIDYQPDMAAKITMTYAAPGLPAADDGLIDDNGAGPKPPPGVLPPPPPSAFRLTLDESAPAMTQDGPRFTVIAAWDMPTDASVTHVEVHYRIGEGPWNIYQAAAGNPSYPITNIPPETQVWGKARCVNGAGASEFTEEATIITPAESEFLPKMPTDLQLEQRDYRQGNGRILYFIQVSWTVEGLTGGTLIEWIKETDIADGVWPEDKKSSKFISGAGQFFEIEGVGVAIYHVRVASQGILRNDQYSAWNEGSLEILVYDYPPSPPTNLRATSTPSGVKLEWDNPLDSDWVGIEIHRNNANDRDGRTELPVIPPAKCIATVPNTGTETGTYFDALDDSVWHWYWIRSYDSEDGITATNRSSFERPGNNDGVRGRAGIHGDGLPPPPPINLVLYPGVWQITLQWEQSQEIPDLRGTQIYYSKTNDRGPDEALLATYLGETDENFATHLDLEAGDTYYYWIRNIDVENPPQYSTWLPADRYGGAAATVSLDPRKFLELLNGAITETQLAQSLLGLINTQNLEGNSTFLELKQVVEALKALFTVRIQQSFEGLTEVSGFGMGSEIQNNQIVSQFLVQADRFAVGAPAVYNADEVLLVPIQYDWDGNLPTVYDIEGNVITLYGVNGLPLPAYNPDAKGFIRNVYDAEGNRIPIYDAEGNYFPTPRWDGFIVTTEEYINSEGKMIPPGVYIRNANIAEGSIDGAKIRADSITADRIDTRGLTIKDNAGKVIFSANMDVNLVSMFGQEVSDIIGALKRHDIHLYIKNGVIGDLYIADTLSSIDYTPWSVDLNGEPIPGTGWRIQRGDLNQGEPSVIETDNLIARGELSSEIYYPGISGWKLFRDGSCEFNNGVFRGTLGAETLLVGSDFSLGQLSEQIMLASLNIMVSNQYFTFTEAGADAGDETITMFANNLDNVVWSAKAYPGEVPVDLVIPPEKPRYRLLTIDKIRNGTGFYDYIAVTAQFQDRFDQVKIFPLRDNSGIVTAELSNARVNLAADSRGYVGNYTKAVGIFRVYLGKNPVAKAALAYTVLSTTNCSVSIVSDPTKPDHGYYKVTEVTDKTASATLRVTYNGVHYDRLIEIFVYQAVLSGTPGDPGEDGTDGKRGSKFFAFYSYDPGGYTEATWTTMGAFKNVVDELVEGDPGGEGVVVLWDVVTLINYTSGWSETRMRRDTGWEPIVAFFNGDILVKGTIYADKIVSNSIIQMSSNVNYVTPYFAGGNQWQTQIGWAYPDPKYTSPHPEMTAVNLLVTVTMDCPSDLTGVRIAYEEYGRRYSDNAEVWVTQHREIFNRGSAYYSAKVFTATISLNLLVPPGKAFYLNVEAKQLGTQWVNADANMPSLTVLECYSSYYPDDGWRIVTS